MNTKIKNFLINIYAYSLPTVGGLLGALGGAEQKSLRRILIPLLLIGLAYFETESILVITICSMMGALSIGYGIPGDNDSGSWLGRFYYNLFHQNHFLADIFTRGTIGLFIGLSLLSIPIIKKNWFVYFLGVLCIILTNAFISWRNFGFYHLFGKELSWVETITWGIITLLVVLIIKLK
jgi:hypothetical protein